MLALSPFVVSLALLAAVVTSKTYPTWCGKYYQPSAPRIAPAPSTRYQIPPVSPTPLLDFRCSQAIRPYISGMDVVGEVIVDMALDDRIGVGWDREEGEEVLISVSFGAELESTTTPTTMRIGAKMGKLVSVDLGQLPCRSAPYMLTCTASDSAGDVIASSPPSPFRFLCPRPSSEDKGSIIKIDSRTSALLTPTAKNGAYEPFFPIGFYVEMGGYLETNLSLLDEMVDRGFNVFHPVPPFEDLKALENVLDRAEKLGLWLMYDMRWTYMNDTAVREQVEMIKSRKNLLLWYTADEPDGPSDPLNATTLAYGLIQSLDPYHPISLVLNCADFEWSQYTAGADIILTDPYPLYVNTTWSDRYGTECNEEFGCCGCDNCVGSLHDVVTKLDDSYARRHYEGRDRNLSTWLVPQALGGDEFWTRKPSGQEFLAMSTLGLIHGAKGILPWVLPTSNSILGSATLLANALPKLSSFLLDPSAKFTSLKQSFKPSLQVDAGLWTSESGKSLLIVVGLLNETSAARFPRLGSMKVENVVLDSGTATISKDAKGRNTIVALNAFGTGAWILLETSSEPDSATSGEPGLSLQEGSRQMVVNHVANVDVDSGSP